MSQTIIKPEVAEETEQELFIPAQPGRQPISNLEAFMATLPDVEPEEAEAFEQAIAENRAQRRAIVKDFKS